MEYVFSELAASNRRIKYDLWTCHALVGHGSSMWEVVKQAGHNPVEIDSMIRGGPNAYDGLSDLVRKFCVRPRGLEIHGNTTVIELIAPLSVRFDREKVTSSPDHVTVALRTAADIFVAKAELAWSIDTIGKPFRHGSIRLCERKWADEQGILHSQIDIPIQKGDTTATFFVLIGDRCADRVSVPLIETGSNIRMRTHSVLDAGLHKFLEKLRPEALNKAKEFEDAVGLLFFFLGFHVNSLHAQRGLGDAVDHLAHAPGSSVILAIECTVGPIDGKGKLGKLIARSEIMRSKLPDSKVIAVLTTARPRAELSKVEIEKAKTDGVALLAREDLDELWAAAQAGETSADVVRRLKQKLTQRRPRRA